MQRMFQIRFEALNEHGGWVPDVLNNHGRGYTFKEADMMLSQLKERETVRNAYITDMVPHW